MWDANEVDQAAEDMKVTLKASISNTPDLQEEKEHRALEQEYVEAQIKKAEEGKVKVTGG